MFLRFLIKENFINKNIFDHIKSPHIERTHKKDYLTANQYKFLINSIAENAMRNIGIDDRRHSAHSLRHTAATLALLNGKKLANVQQTLRHSNINTTMIYAHALEREELTVSNAIFQD